MDYSKQQIKSTYSFEEIIEIINNCKTSNELFKAGTLLDEIKREFSLNDLDKIELLINLKRDYLKNHNGL